MSPIQEARVPHIMQNDAAKPVPILCGPASIQAILYGLDNANFTPPTSAALRVGVPVIADQATIFDEVKRVTTTVASQAGFAAGAAGPELICEQQPGGGPPLCWVTHPKVLAAVVKQGIATSTLTLQGVQAATVRTILEREAPAALLDSIALGVGAALLIDETALGRRLQEHPFDRQRPDVLLPRSDDHRRNTMGRPGCHDVRNRRHRWPWDLADGSRWGQQRRAARGTSSSGFGSACTSASGSRSSGPGRAPTAGPIGQTGVFNHGGQDHGDSATSCSSAGG